MTHTATITRTPTRTRKLFCSALLGTALMAAAIPATSFAKEIGSGGGTATGGTTACSPISSLTVKADPRAGETGVATMDVSYGVKACNKGQALNVDVNVSETVTGTLFVDMPESPLNGKFTLGGIKVRVSYKVTVTAFDAATGAVAGTQSAFVAAIPKGV